MDVESNFFGIREECGLHLSRGNVQMGKALGFNFRHCILKLSYLVNFIACTYLQSRCSSELSCARKSVTVQRNHLEFNGPNPAVFFKQNSHGSQRTFI